MSAFIHTSALLKLLEMHELIRVVAYNGHRGPSSPPLLRMKHTVAASIRVHKQSIGSLSNIAAYDQTARGQKR